MSDNASVFSLSSANTNETGSTVDLKLERFKLHSEDLLEPIVKFYESGMLTDLVLNAEGEEFKCHKIILAAASECLREKIFPTTEMIPLPGIAPRIMKICIAHMYTGQNDFNDGNVMDVFCASKILQLKKLEDKCLEHMLQQSCSRNAVEYYTFAVQHELSSLIEKTKNCICADLKNPCITQELEHASRTVMESLLSNRQGDETDWLKTLIAWYNSELQRGPNRDSTRSRSSTASSRTPLFSGFQQLTPLINQINFNNVSLDYLFDIQKNERLMDLQPHRNTICDAIQFHSNELVALNRRLETAMRNRDAIGHSTNGQVCIKFMKL